MRKLLLAVHGGSKADGAVHVARLLRERSGASIEVVAVLEPLPILDYGYGAVYLPDPDTEDRLEQQLRIEVEKQLARCGLAGATLSVLRGQRVATIANLATARSANLVIVGAGAHHVTDRALGGETALQLAQHASTPILAVPAATRSLPRRALVAVDFSRSSLAAARLATLLLTEGDTLELAHIAAAAQIGAVVLGPSHMGDAERRMEDFVAELSAPSGIRLAAHVFGGEPTRTLLEVASDTRADVIALGSHGYGLWQRMVLGSVSSRVLRLAPCAVLIYPSRCIPAAEEAVAGASSARSAATRV
jgi:nucleotide-binding universal stress UspA family protein